MGSDLALTKVKLKEALERVELIHLGGHCGGKCTDNKKENLHSSM